MRKRPVNFTKRVETWTVRQSDGSAKSEVRIAVRANDGRFHGATNYRQRGSL